MKTKGLKKVLKVRAGKSYTKIENEKGEVIEADFLSVLLNLDKLTK